MKMLVAVVEKERQQEVLELLREAAVKGFSVIPSVFGKGETGAHFGNRAFPGENSMILALVSPAELDQLSRSLGTFATRLRAEEAFKVIALDADLIV
ncbi:MAG: hypothetical protein SFV24_00810 [Gemmatimonadales bacterium]|nr:hypothetical protein [Gemmatimonadota bacterium]MCC7132793.1 hypothetical protein [Gemmatimonadales bacterium]MDX2056312.1 hypothetical protein [Gemmatimonadales bacterium]